MKAWERYIQKHQIETRVGLTHFENQASGVVVVIPCYDEPNIKKVLQSIEKCTPLSVGVSVVVVINSGVNTPLEIVQQNRNTYSELVRYLNDGTFQHFKLVPLILENIPRKHAGVGYARKKGMDYAIGYFDQTQNCDGILISLDADCEVSPNFLSEIYKAYQNDSQLGITLQAFEHGLKDEATRCAIIQYEMYLRYFRLGQLYAGFPHPIHTIGSCFSVKAMEYVKHGGMNRKQGGEDFYFLHKLVPHVKYAVLNPTKVFPSSRISHRVPFGTGPALQKITEENTPWQVYHPESFELLRSFYAITAHLFEVADENMESYLRQNLDPEFLDLAGLEKLIASIQESRKNVSNEKAFVKRFFQHWDAFTMVKLLNEMHQELFSKIDVRQATALLLQKMGVQNFPSDAMEQIMFIREVDEDRN